MHVNLISMEFNWCPGTSIDKHGYPESLSSPNGTPLELPGLQPSQYRWFARALLCEFRGFHVSLSTCVSRCRFVILFWMGNHEKQWKTRKQQWQTMKTMKSLETNIVVADVGLYWPVFGRNSETLRIVSKAALASNDHCGRFHVQRTWSIACPTTIVGVLRMRHGARYVMTFHSRSLFLMYLIVFKCF